MSTTAIFLGKRLFHVAAIFLLACSVRAQSPYNDHFTNRIPITATATLSTNADATFSVALTDLNNDGFVDVVVGNQNQRSHYFLNNGSSAPFYRVLAGDVTTNVTPLWSIATGDVTGDGWPDVVVGNIGQSIRLYTNNHTASPFTNVTSRTITADVNDTFALIITNLNGVAGADVLAANGGSASLFSRFYTNNGTANPFNAITGLNIAGQVYNSKAIGVGDVNGDGRLDVVLGNNNQRSRLYTNNGTASPFTNVTGVDIGTDSFDMRAVVVADVNGDGRADVITGGRGRNIRLFLNNGTANPFNGVAGVNISSDTNQTTSLAVGDVNGDGRPDLVAGNEDQRIRLYLNNGTLDPFNGVSGVDISPESLPTISVALGDVNGDGLNDLVVGNLTHTNRVYFNNGTSNPFNPSYLRATGTNTFATKETNEPNHAGFPGGKSLWWTWTATNTGPYTITTLGSSFDTLLGVYIGTAYPLSLIVSNDDINGVLNRQSSVTFGAVAGTVYQIAVDGYAGESGRVILNVLPATPPSLTITCPSDLTTNNINLVPPVNTNEVVVQGGCPPYTRQFLYDTYAAAGCQTIITRYYQATDICGTSVQCAQTITVNEPYNDYFANAIDLGSGYVSTTGCNVGATTEFNEPSHAGNGPTKSVWWTWTSSSSDPVTIDTIGSSFDTLLAVYEGDINTFLSEKASNDQSGGNNTSKLTFKPTAFTTYHVAVDGYFGDSGNIKLKFSPCPLPQIFSIYIANQQVVPQGIAITLCANTSGASTFEWTIDGVLQPGNSSCVTFTNGAADDDSLHTYNLIVRNSCGFTGSGDQPVGQTCSVCLNRGVPNLLVGTNGTGSGPTLNTTNCGTLSVNTRWFKMLLYDNGFVTLSTEGTTNDTRLAVYIGSILNPAGMTRIACSEDISTTNKQSRLTFNATAGITYWVALDPKTNNAPTLRLASGFEPQIDTYRFTTGKVFEVFTTPAPQIPYKLEMTTNVVSPVWSTVQVTNPTVSYPYLHFRDTTATNSTRRFYRLKSSP